MSHLQVMNFSILYKISLSPTSFRIKYATIESKGMNLSILFKISLNPTSFRIKYATI